jgi:hypothetical protein
MFQLLDNKRSITGSKKLLSALQESEEELVSYMLSVIGVPQMRQTLNTDGW